MISRGVPRGFIGTRWSRRAMELAVEFHGCGPLNTTVLREQRFYLGVAWRIGTVVLARDGGSGRRESRMRFQWVLRPGQDTRHPAPHAGITTTERVGDRHRKRRLEYLPFRCDEAQPRRAAREQDPGRRRPGPQVGKGLRSE